MAHESTPNMGIPYLSDSDALKETTTVAREQAYAIEQEMERLERRIDLEGGGGGGSNDGGLQVFTGTFVGGTSTAEPEKGEIAGKIPADVSVGSIIHGDHWIGGHLYRYKHKALNLFLPTAPYSWYDHVTGMTNYAGTNQSNVRLNIVWNPTKNALSMRYSVTSPFDDSINTTTTVPEGEEPEVMATIGEDYTLYLYGLAPYVLLG